MKQFIIKIPEELHKDVKIFAVHHSVSMNNLVLSAIEFYLDSLSEEVDESN